MKKKVLVCILDGWGLGKNNSYNAIFLAKKKKFELFEKKKGELKIKTFEKEVGFTCRSIWKFRGWSHKYWSWKNYSPRCNEDFKIIQQW